MATYPFNQTTRAGQSLILQSGPLPAVLTLTALQVSTAGETASSYYLLEFRLTGYGMKWPAAWLPLTPAELLAASLRFSGRMQHVQVRFTHQGAPAQLSVDHFTATGTATPPKPLTGLLASHYLASGVYGTHAHENLALALLAKLYRPGLLPDFLTRGEGEDPAPELDDQDFLDLWLTSCRFFALVILHARRLGELPHDAELLAAYLTQRGIYLRPGRADLGELRQLLAGQYQAGEQRGTAAVFEEAGEFSRLINRSTNASQAAALRAAYAPADQVGWVLGQVGPGHAGTAAHPSTFLRYQATSLVRASRKQLPITNLATVGYDDGSLTPRGLVPHQALALQPTGEVTAELGALLRLPTDRQTAAGGPVASAVAIDPAVDYEVLWLVRQPNQAAITRLTLHLANGYGYPVPALEHGTSAPASLVVEGPFPAAWTWVRTVLWNYRQLPGTNVRQLRTNLGTGAQLRATSAAALAYPGAFAELRNGQGPGAPALLVADIIVRPLVVGTSLHPQAPRAGTKPSSRPAPYDVASGPRPPAYLGSGPHLMAWYRNQNPSLTEADIARITRRELVPADCHLVLHPAP